MASGSINKIELLNSLIDDIYNLPFGDREKLDAFESRSKMILANIFGANSEYISDLRQIRFFPLYTDIRRQPSQNQALWESGKTKSENVIKTCLEEVRLACELNSEIKDVQFKQPVEAVPEVFVVHGHDEEMKQSVARVLEKLDLKPIILHEKPDQGRTIIEKFIEHSQVQFAVVLFSPDDMGHSKTASPDTAKHRARQNVVLELGFFLGKLGRDSVVVLYKNVPNFEMPTDYSGVLFKAYEGTGWQFELVRELNAKGFKVDANKLI